MNALYADRDGAITDFFGGVADARAGTVRFIGDPAARIAEDGLRILRFFRFHAWYGRSEPDPEGLAAATVAAAAIDRLSGERVRDEMLKLLRAPDPVPVWLAMIDAGIMAHVIPAATRTEDAERLIAAEAALGLPPDPLRRLAALTGPLDSPAVAALAGRLRLSNRDAAGLGAIAAPGVAIAAMAADGFARALYETDPSALRDAALVSHARSGRPERSTIAALLQFAAGWTEPRFPVTGSDIVACGISPGPAVGALLAELEAWWVAQGFRPDRDRCLRELARLAAGRG
jgi:poly(A) polymerase